MFLVRKPWFIRLLDHMQTPRDKSISEIPNTPLQFFLYLSKPYKKWAVLAVLFAVFASAANQSLAYFFKLIVDAVESGAFKTAMLFALLYPVANFFIQLLYRGSGFTGVKWIVGAEKDSYDLLSRYVMRQGHSYFSNRFSGSILSKVSNVTGVVDRLISDFLWTYTQSLIALLVMAGFLFSIDVKSAITFVLLVVVLVLFNRYLAPEQALYAKLSAEAATDLRGRVVDTISNIQAVRQYVRFGQEVDSLADYSDRLKERNYRRYINFEWVFFLNGLLLAVFSILMFWQLFSGWQSGDVTTGDAVLILALYSNISGTLIFIGRAFNSGARAWGEMKEGLEELLLPYEIVDVSGAEQLTVSEASIEWKEVKFNFGDNGVFKDFNLTIPAGQRLGLVGQSGAGKTTFVSLLLRQHELGAGSIEIGGQDISQVTQDSLRQAIAVVPQEPALFHRTIRENILYGNPNATEEMVIEVAKKAQAHDFIMELPEGYDTLVGERGVKLSGGQKQRVAIARAMLKDAPILVLDEATSALDSESEVAIQQALEALMEGRTVIAIAHRLSTLRRMDRIIVMEQGRIIEDGTHESLSHNNGVYERLWNHQVGGFLQDE